MRERAWKFPASCSGTKTLLYNGSKLHCFIIYCSFSVLELVHCGLKDVAFHFIKDGLADFFEIYVKPTLPSYCVLHS